VTYGLLAVLAFGVWNHTEAWPITSYRLFSQVRTGTSSSLQLVALDADGARQPVRPRGDTVATTAHQLHRLPTLDRAEQRRRAVAWLREAGIDPSTVRTVLVERVTVALDPDGGPSRETGRRVVVEIAVGP